MATLGESHCSASVCPLLPLPRHMVKREMAGGGAAGGGTLGLQWFKSIARGVLVLSYVFLAVIEDSGKVVKF